jgi:hypothetical protein
MVGIMTKTLAQIGLICLGIAASSCTASSETLPDAGATVSDTQTDSGAEPRADTGSDAGEVLNGDAGGCEGNGQACPPGERCSVYGRCFAGECLVHADCTAEQRCHQARCLNRPNPELGVLFERVHGMAFADHLSSIPTGSERRSASAYGDFGFGAALFDMDGDRDLDLFIASQGRANGDDSPSCIYRND